VKKKNPVTVRKLPGGGYRVTDNGKVTAFNTTKKKAFAQVALLRGVQHGMKIRKNPKGQKKIYGWLMTFYAGSRVGIPSRLQFASRESALDYVYKNKIKHVESLAPITKEVKGILGKVKNPAWLIPGLRAARAVGAKKRKNPVTVHSTSKPIEIYGRLLRIEAQKGTGHFCDAKCKAAGHRYFHNFSKHAYVYGMPDGSLKIVDRT
jgi:hypothetical protein